MNKSELDLLEELKNKSKLTPQEKAKLKALSRKNGQGNAENQRQNVFDVESTTKIDPVPVRFLAKERAGLKTRAGDIKRESLEQICDILGPSGVRDINESKLIRAAVFMLKEKTNVEIIEAIKEVQMQMFNGKKG